MRSKIVVPAILATLAFHLATAEADTDLSAWPAGAEQQAAAAAIEALADGLEGDGPPHAPYSLFIDGCQARLAGGRIEANFSLGALDYEAALGAGADGPLELKSRVEAGASPPSSEMRRRFAEIQNPPRVIACFFPDDRTPEQIEADERLSRSRILANSHARLLRGDAGEYFRRNHIVYYDDPPGDRDGGEDAAPLISDIAPWHSVQFVPKQSPEERAVNDSFAQVGRLVRAMKRYAETYCATGIAAD